MHGAAYFQKKKKKKYAGAYKSSFLLLIIVYFILGGGLQVKYRVKNPFFLHGRLKITEPTCRLYSYVFSNGNRIKKKKNLKLLTGLKFGSLIIGVSTLV